MNKKVSAADANRRFSKLLRTAENGRSVVVASHGKPVAKISPVVADNRVAEAARSALFARLRRERAVNAGRVRNSTTTSDEDCVKLQCSRVRRGRRWSGHARSDTGSDPAIPPEAVVLPVQASGELFNVLVRKVKRHPSRARAAVLELGR
jgi:prevent-host-death family protein